MKTAWSWIVRIGVLAVCALLTVWSVKMAVADWRAQHNGMAGLESAIALEPGDSVLVARAALAKNANGDMSADVDRELLHAAAMNPYEADVQMALGLREEFRGHQAEAEQYLIHAAEIDHTFKPAWTLANFYVRQDQAEKAWPLIKRGLALDPLVFDPTPVFDLLWSVIGNSRKILALVPERGPMPIQYLYYLISKHRFDAAIELWPRAWEAVPEPDQSQKDVLISFSEFLEQANRLPESIKVWNQLVDKGIIVTGRIDPAAGVSITDPDFSFPLIERGFGWRLTHDQSVSVAKAASSLRLEFDGNEPEDLQLLATVAPLVPGRTYRLIWKADASELSARQDPGFAWQITQQPGNAINICSLLLQAGDDGKCTFTSVPPAEKAGIELIYRRASGTTRVQGMLRIATVRLEFGS